MDELIHAIKREGNLSNLSPKLINRLYDLIETDIDLFAEIFVHYVAYRKYLFDHFKCYIRYHKITESYVKVYIKLCCIYNYEPYLLANKEITKYVLKKYYNVHINTYEIASLVIDETNWFIIISYLKCVKHKPTLPITQLINLLKDNDTHALCKFNSVESHFSNGYYSDGFCMMVRSFNKWWPQYVKLKHQFVAQLPIPYEIIDYIFDCVFSTIEPCDKFD